jgi:hypothetical protein
MQSLIGTNDVDAFGHLYYWEKFCDAASVLAALRSGCQLLDAESSQYLTAEIKRSKPTFEYRRWRILQNGTPVAYTTEDVLNELWQAGVLTT